MRRARRTSDGKPQQIRTGEEVVGAGASGGLGFGVAVADAWTVLLPRDVREPFQVYVNGVLQEPGRDYDVAGTTLVFAKPLAQEGRLGWLRWTSIFLGVAGTYRRDDAVDVVYEVDGRRRVAHKLPIVAPRAEPGE